MSLAIDLHGKTAVVTGGSRGIGRAVSVALSQAGAYVVVVARTQESLAKTVGLMEGAGGRGEARAVDLGETGEAARLVTGVVADHGPLDILVNCAGISPAYVPAERASEEDWEATVAVNLKAAFFASQAAACGMIEAGKGGCIVNVASVGGMVGLSRLAIYCATKGGIVQMTKTMALDWAKYAIRVNALCPGWVETDMTEGLRASPALNQSLIDGTPLGRLAHPEEIGRPVAFLCSDMASFITGSCIVVDGGWTAR